jgi:hypothetical protein
MTTFVHEIYSILEYISLFPRVIYFYVELNTIIVMTFKEDFKPSRVYNKLVIDAINKDIANDRSIIIPNTFDIDVKNNNKNIYVVLDVWNVLIQVKLLKDIILMLVLMLGEK